MCTRGSYKAHVDNWARWQSWQHSCSHTDDLRVMGSNLAGSYSDGVYKSILHIHDKKSMGLHRVMRCINW